jgi:small GTP-binding protein
MSDYTVLKIGLTGSACTGKSNIAAVLTNRVPKQDYVSTIGADFTTLYYPEKHFKLQFWDLSGQERFIPIVESYVRHVSVMLMVYSLDNMETFNHLKFLYKLYNGLEKNVGKKEIKYILVGNKSDLYRVVPKQIVIEFANKIGASFIDVSARTSHNMDRLLTIITKDLLNKIERNNDRENCILTQKDCKSTGCTII